MTTPRGTISLRNCDRSSVAHENSYLPRTVTAGHVPCIIRQLSEPQGLAQWCALGRAGDTTWAGGCSKMNAVDFATKEMSLPSKRQGSSLHKTNHCEDDHISLLEHDVLL